MKQVYIRLLNMKIRIDNFQEVVETVLGDLTNVITDGPLPSAALTLKRTRTIIAELQELQECGDEWSLINFDKKFNKL